MAYYAALASIVELLEDIILGNRYSNFPLGNHEVVKSLHEKFGILEGLLQDYSSKGDEANDRVEGRIRDVAYRAQDIIDFEISNWIRSFACNSESEESSEDLEIQEGDEKYVEDLQMQEKDEKYIEDLDKLQQEIDSIVEEVGAVKERQRIEGLLIDCDSADLGKQALIGGNTMVGFDDDLMRIKDQLCGQTPQLRTISIVGTGGMGKTTLAQSIFDDALITYRFDHLAWVTVSQSYKMDRVLEGILKYLGYRHFRGETEYLKERIYKSLKGMRYLIVIDDVWSTEILDCLKQICPNDCNGSRIMVTTRLSNIAKYAATSHFVHEMHFLNEDESWSMLQNRVFAEKVCPPDLEDIGKLISSKCGGLPLAIAVIAGVLTKFRTPQDWNNIAANVVTILSRDDQHFSSILSLSYNHLPPQLKACFLYMGSFPEDYEINISNLIRLWIAEGFLKLTDKSETLENVAERCLEDLVRRNLVITTKKRPSGQFKFCILHDLLRDFCRQRAFHECFFHVEQEEGCFYPRQVENVRRINMNSNFDRESLPCNIGKLVRTIRWYKQENCRSFYGIKHNSVDLFRVLDVPERHAYTLDTFLQMFHLRYVAVQTGNLVLVPLSISVHQNLQSLIIDIAGSLPAEVPEDIWKMTQLRHLIITQAMILPLVPMVGSFPVQKLEHLQTLMTVQDFRFTNQAIQMIPNLRKLEIRFWQDVPHSTWELYCLYNLVHLLKLEELKISVKMVYGLPCVQFRHSFAFPQNLVKLSLGGCQLPWKAVKMFGSLPNLHVLKLRWKSFVGGEWEPTEGEFLCLKFLLLESLDLKYWQAETSHFPSLEHLKIRHCNHLEEIPLEIGDIPTLKFIDIYESKCTENSATKIREEQQDLGNDVLQVRVDYW